MMEDFPRSEPHGSYEDGQYLLTHVVWRNGYGSYQPETGVRFINSTGKYGDFQLIQHGWRDFAKAQQMILRGLRKGWDVCRIEDFMCHLRKRKRCL